MNRLSSFVKRVRGSSSFSRRDRDAERPTRTGRHHQEEPEFDKDEPLDLEPLHYEMPDEEMHEVEPQADAHILTRHCCLTFVDRWYGETSSFHISSGEITVTLDDVCYLMHLPNEGTLIDHEGVIDKP
jgi:hypothetical protein